MPHFSVGTFALLDSPTAVEMVGFAGFDFVIIDTEHSANTAPFGSGLLHMLRAASAAKITAYVRVRANDPAMIATALDCGAAGIIVPGISSAEEMRRAVASATWQPRGARGAAPFGRVHEYGFRPIDMARDTATPLIGPLIENRAGFDDLDAIAATPGVGWLWFGHFDMAVSLGKPSPVLPDEEIEAMRDRMHAVAKAHNIPAAAFTWDAATARRLAERGAGIIAISADISLLASGLRTVISDVKAGAHPSKEVTS